MLEPALLKQVEEGCAERDQQSGVGGQEKGHVEENPSVVDQGEGRCLLTWTEGRDETEEEADRKDEDTEGDGLVSPVDKKEGDG